MAKRLRIPSKSFHKVHAPVSTPTVEKPIPVKKKKVIEPEE